MAIRKEVATWILAALITAAIARAQSIEESGSEARPLKPTPDLSAVATRIIDSTNHFREEQGREATQPNPDLTTTADDFARYMAECGKFGHTADGRQPSERASQHGYQYCIIAENIAYQYNSRGFGGKQLARRFVTGWENSPEHRKNMLDRDVTETGVGIARSNSNGAYYAVQLFGRPKSKQLEFQVSNPGSQTVNYTVKGRTDEQAFSLPLGVIRTHRRCRSATLEVSENGEHHTQSIENGGRYTIADGAIRPCETGQ